MARLPIEQGAWIHYEADDFATPWAERDPVLLLHGNAESSAAWYGWMPTLAARFTVIRPDMRGFGLSSPMPRDFDWTVDTVLADFVRLMDTLGFERFHLVGAKIGGTLALALAGRYPERVRTVTAICALGSGSAVAPQVAHWLDQIERLGVEGWARATMPVRLGSAFPAAGAEWWARLMGRTAPTTQLGFLSSVPRFDIDGDLPRIRCPALIVTTAGNQLASVDETRRWSSAIGTASVCVLPGDSYHAAASDPALCAEAVIEFIERSGRRSGADGAPAAEIGRPCPAVPPT